MGLSQATALARPARCARLSRADGGGLPPRFRSHPQVLLGAPRCFARLQAAHRASPFLFDALGSPAPTLAGRHRASIEPPSLLGRATGRSLSSGGAPRVGPPPGQRPCAFKRATRFHLLCSWGATGRSPPSGGALTGGAATLTVPLCFHRLQAGRPITNSLGLLRSCG